MCNLEHFGNKITELAAQFGYLPYIIDRYFCMLGEKETRKLLFFNEKRLNDTIRINTLRNNLEQIISFLEHKGIKLNKIHQIKEGREVLSSPVPIGATPEYLNGYYMLQGKNSMYPSLILKPRKDMLVGDLAAAPGGKTSHLAQIMDNNGKIVAFDISANRCRSLKSNLSRMGVRNSIVLQIDSRSVRKTGLKFDKILLDAPCSGSGVIVNDKSRKTNTKLVDILNYTNYQIDLLSAAIDSLKPKGEIVYCTCSLEPEENELVISRVLKKKNVSLIDINLPGGEPGLINFKDYTFVNCLAKARRLYPHKTNGEGFFITKMVKNK